MLTYAILSLAQQQLSFALVAAFGLIVVAAVVMLVVSLRSQRKYNSQQLPDLVDHKPEDAVVETEQRSSAFALHPDIESEHGESSAAAAGGTASDGNYVHPALLESVEDPRFKNVSLPDTDFSSERHDSSSLPEYDPQPQQQASSLAAPIVKSEHSELPPYEHHQQPSQNLESSGLPQFDGDATHENAADYSPQDSNDLVRYAESSALESSGAGLPEYDPRSYSTTHPDSRASGGSESASEPLPSFDSPQQLQAEQHVQPRSQEPQQQNDSRELAGATLVPQNPRTQQLGDSAAAAPQSASGEAPAAMSRRELKAQGKLGADASLVPKNNKLFSRR